MAHDGTSHPPLENAPGLTSSEPTPLPNAPGLTSSIPENVEDLIDLPINPDVLADAMPSEPVCPSIPGVTFPELPDPEAFGKLIGEKIGSAEAAISETFEDLEKKAKALEERIKNPPSPTDMMSEMATQVSSAAEKAAKALEAAATDIAEQVEEQLAAEFDKIAEAFTDLEAAMEAIRSGAVDIGALGMDILEIPGKILEGAFAGFKNAAECLKGAAGSAVEAFNKTSAAISEGIAEGRGESAAASDDKKTEKTKEEVDEDGNPIIVQETISPDDAIASVEGTTREVVPTSDIPLQSAVYEEREPEVFTPTNTLSDIAAKLGDAVLTAGLGVSKVSEHSKHGGYEASHKSKEHKEDRAIDIGTGYSAKGITQRIGGDGGSPLERQFPIISWLQDWSRTNDVTLRILWTDNATKHDDHIHVGVVDSRGLA